MQERVISVLLLIGTVYATVWAVVTKQYDLAGLYAFLAVAGFWTVHAVWSASGEIDESDEGGGF